MHFLLCMLLITSAQTGFAQAVASEGPAGKVTEIVATTSSPEAQAIFKEALAAYDMGKHVKPGICFQKQLKKIPILDWRIS